MPDFGGPPFRPIFPKHPNPKPSGQTTSRLGPLDLNQQPPLPSRARTGVCGQMPTGRAENDNNNSGVVNNES